MTIQITKNEDKEIEVTFEDGSKRNFYPGWQVIMDVHDIQEAQEIRHETDDGIVAKRYLMGTAWLQDRDISIIGEPDKKTRSLKLSIFDREIEAKPDVDELPGLFNPAGFANIGFNRADGEFDTDDQWYVSLYLPKAAFEPLYTTVAEGKIARMHLVMRLNVFTANHPMAPTCRSESLYLRPADPSASFDWPKTADGYVVAITTGKTSFAIAPPQEPDPYAYEEEAYEPREPAPVPSDPVAAAVANLSASLEKLRTSLKWGVGLIFVALVFLVGK